MSRHHYLKTLPEYFAAQESGVKPFEVRLNDRDFRVGDVLHLLECMSPDTYTGREMSCEVTYVLCDPEYCKEGYVVLGTGYAHTARRTETQENEFPPNSNAC